MKNTSYDIKSGGLRSRSVIKSFKPNIPLVTIITPSYNSEKYIEKTIQSVLNQNYLNIEYIIIDGGSTDGTIEIIKRYEDKIDYWISEPDQGIYHAMHKGIMLATGEIIGNINSDDYYVENIISPIVDIFKENQTISIVHGGINVIDLNGHFLKYMPGNHNKLYKSMSVRHPSVFIKKEVYIKMGGYDYSFTIGADRELMLRLHRAKYLFFNVDIAVANFRLGGVSDGISKTKMKEAIRLYKKYKLSVFRYFIVYLIKPTIVTLFFRKNTHHNSFRKRK